MCIGILITSVITLATVDDIYGSDNVELSREDRDRYRVVAGWLMGVAIADIILQVIMAIVQGCIITADTRKKIQCIMPLIPVSSTL